MKFTHTSGTKVLPGYTIKRGIGQGGFGEVYYATSDAGKEVALKLVQRGRDVELRGVLQCLNLKHPNLIELYDVRENEDGETWVIMEYMSGPSLDQVTARHPHGLPASEIDRWFVGLAEGVAFLHDRGIVHRDLKPGNVFKNGDAIKLGDYGLSKFMTVSQREGHTESIGTVHYMAPEVSKGHYGKEIDIYALGIILYEMVSGNVPFEGESVGEILMKHLTATPDLSKISEPYRSVVKRCLEKDPKRRFGSVKELLAALRGEAGEDVVYIGPEQAAEEQDGITWLGEPTHTGPRPQPRPQPVHYVGEEADESASHWIADEPIAKFIGQSWRSLSERPAALVVVLVCLFVSFWVAAPLWIGALWLYAIYWITRLIVLGIASAFSPLPTANTSRGTPRQYQPVRSPRRQPKMVRRLPAKTTRQRATELFGSLFVGSVAAAALCMLLLGVYSQWMNETVPLEQFALLGLVGMAGAWAVLLPAKVWEGKPGRSFRRRFVMLALGVLVGLAAFAADAGLMVHFDDPAMWNTIGSELQQPTWEQGATPNLVTYVGFFGVLFFVLRWWHQADPLRTSRVSLLSLLLCGIWGFLLNLVFPLPAAWGVIWAVLISLAVQVAAPVQEGELVEETATETAGVQAA